MPLNPANLSQGCKTPYLAAASAVTAPVDLVHDWAPAHTAYDNGSMDGFYQAEGHQNSTFLYYNGAEIPTYWDLAEQYGIGDNFFASALSYSTPNHWYLVAGATPAQGVNQSLNRQGVGSTRLTAAEQEYINEANTTPTIVNLLANTSVSWKYYDYALTTYNQAINSPSGAGAQGSAFDFWNPLASQASSYSASTKSHFVGSSSFFNDAAAGKPPQCLLGASDVRQLGPPVREPQQRGDVGLEYRQRRRDLPRLEQHRYLRHLGRLRGLLRQRPSTARRRDRSVVPGPAAGDQPLGPGGVYQPPVHLLRVAAPPDRVALPPPIPDVPGR